jgi:SRSO17 transposase
MVWSVDLMPCWWSTTPPCPSNHSPGVARQYCGCLGKRANCQVLASLTLAKDEVPVPTWLRLFLPQAWTADADRCAEAACRQSIGMLWRRPRSR